VTCSTRCEASCELVFAAMGIVTFPCDFPLVQRLEGGSGKASRRVMLGDLPSTIQVLIIQILAKRSRS
jgi:hypothetical protein